MAACFSPLISVAQLKELGRPDIAFGPNHIRIDQFFRTPWAVDEDHANLYCKTVHKMASMEAFEAKTNLLFQLVALFSTLGIDAMSANLRILRRFAGFRN
jgi:hypothetical protein